MQPMRRSDREVLDLDEILDIIEACDVCRIAMVDDGVPYIVPMNFGYMFDGEKLHLCFHSASEGRKLDILRRNPNVCFEMDTDHALTKGETLCQYGMDYASVIGMGTARIVETPREKCEMLSSVMLHTAGRFELFLPEQVKNVAVFEIVSDDVTAKRRRTAKPAEAAKPESGEDA